MRRTFRLRLMLDGDVKPHIYRTDGKPTHCCSLQVDYFCWEKNTKYNEYNGWSGYVSRRVIEDSIKQFNPDALEL